MTTTFSFDRKSLTLPFLIFTITMVGAALRIYHIDLSSLWIDEAWTLYVSQGPWLQVPFMDVHPPLYNWLVKLFILAAHTIYPESVVRAVSLIFAIICIPVTWWLGRELTGYDIPGIIAAVLMAFSAFHLHYSQEARSYTFLLFLFMIFGIYYIRAIRDNKNTDWYAAAVIAVMLVWTHHLMYIPVLFTAAHALIARQFTVSRSMYYAAGIILAGWVLAIPSFFNAIEYRLIEGNTFFYVGFDLLRATLLEFGGGNLVLSIVLLAIAVTGLYALIAKSEYSGGWVLLVSGGYAAVCVVLSYIIMMFPKYLIILLPLFYILVGHGLLYIWATVRANFRDKIAIDVLVFVILVGTLALFLQPVMAHHSGPVTESWREHDAYIQNLTEPGDTVAILANPGYFTLFWYYAPGSGANFYAFHSLDDLREVNEGIDRNYTRVDMYGKPFEKTIIEQPDIAVHGKTAGEPSVWVFIPTPSSPGSDLPEAQAIQEYVTSHGTQYPSYRGWNVYELA